MKGLRAKRILSFIFSRFLLRTQYVVKFVSESLTNSIWVFSESVSTNLRLFQKYEALSTYQWRNRQNFPRMNQAPVEFLRSTCRQMHECTIHHSCYVAGTTKRPEWDHTTFLSTCTSENVESGFPFVISKYHFLSIKSAHIHAQRGAASHAIIHWFLGHKEVLNLHLKVHIKALQLDTWHIVHHWIWIMKVFLALLVVCSLGGVCLGQPFFTPQCSSCNTYGISVETVLNLLNLYVARDSGNCCPNPQYQQCNLLPVCNVPFYLETYLPPCCTPSLYASCL